GRGVGTIQNDDPIPPTPISEIQGSGMSSPIAGSTVTVEAIVTGVDDEIGASFGDNNAIFRFPEDAGIFVQEEAADEDGDPTTSEGIFVGFVSTRMDIPLGSKVRLSGRVKEKFGLTMIEETFGTEPVVLVSGGPLPAPADIDVTEAESQSSVMSGEDVIGKTYYETFEAMRVAVAAGVANSGSTNKFGELFVTPGNRVARVFRQEVAPSLLAADADAGAGDPSNPFTDTDSSTRVDADLFDRVEDLVGPLGFSFGHYKLMTQIDAMPTVVRGPTVYPYTGVAPAGPYQLRVASFNVENFFPVGGALDGGTVGADEYELKKQRIVDAIDRLLLRPDVVALQEVVNLAILQDLAATLGGYTAFLEEGNDNRGIDVGFLVKSTVLFSNARQLGKEAPGSCSDVAGRLFDRPPLAIDIAAPVVSFTIITNHFSSKSAPDSCRAAQAAFVRDRVAELEAAGSQVLVVGDLNAFEDESALTTLEDGTTTLTNLWSRAPEQERYSFAFQGRLQTLDHILVTDGLDSRVDGFQYSHFDNDYYERALQPDGHKVSDHDPPLLTLSTDACLDGDDLPTVVLGEDTGVPNVDTGQGCTIGDLIGEPADFRNHGQYVSHVSHVTNALVERGLLTGKEKGAIQRAAGQNK
ncbi:MAG: endonuclease/exonuclease/phosphatase family protein, partial [Actinomycetota bacterium]|nr:endonuclease/exonuclease/phosphatase family protein [Actinomycetota bacterium]